MNSRSTFATDQTCRPSFLFRQPLMVNSLLFTAVREHLGLALEAARAPVDASSSLAPNAPLRTERSAQLSCPGRTEVSAVAPGATVD